MWNQGGGGDQGQSGGYGDQGGGYLQSPGQFASPGGSQGEKRRSNRAQNIMPVTAAQILAVEQMDDRFFSGEIELHQVTMIGLVKSVNESATRLDYFIDDMTGPPLKVQHFVDNDENTPESERTPTMRENTYVRVTGNVRAFQNQKNIVAFKLAPVTDPNEITCHMLEVIHAHIGHTKAANNVYADPGSNYQGTAAPMDVGGFGGAPDQGLTQTQNQVHMVIKSCSDEQGLNISYICNKLRGVPQKDIRDAVEFLSSEGHIYSTIDDEHFKSTDSG